MAFSSRLGMLVRQNGQASLPSMLNSIRSMSTSKLFIGGLSYGTDDVSLKEAFSGFGEVVEGLLFSYSHVDLICTSSTIVFGMKPSRVITDRDTGRSRGFGFVNFTSDDSASSAMSAMDGQELNGRNIRVSFANERPSGPRSFNNDFRGEGGFNRSGGDY
ncbi:hypothetical protein Pint_25508 [Pistacia integerrima]|uniref:Uncharacterized protein n=1 Tax=Pistacia integerrima TaxID=434235 RepID=A0ACC0YF57_9ROSI|nr:hypothetical protein Pint_25508 [Pistacia integerrima]